MSLAHSFYCWGQMLVVLLTTLLLRLIGTELWYLLPWIWALIPLYNMLMFMRVPIAHPTEGADAMPVRKLFSQKHFGFFLIIMACAGASELSMSQWSSLFAQKGLSVPKVVGDILGPCMFAFLMGLGRFGYGLWGGRINLKYALAGCAGLCILCYLTVALTNNPMLSLAACAVCGFSVSLMWPGAVSMSAKSFPARRYGDVRHTCHVWRLRLFARPMGNRRRSGRSRVRHVYAAHNAFTGADALSSQG